jgi:ATP-binding cassette, subfamily C, type I secretion system permease/ATPase
MMIVLRILGLGLILAVLATAALDGTRTAEAWQIMAASVRDLWAMAHPGSLEFVRTAAEQHLPSNMWDRALGSVLDLPVWFLIGLLGIGFGLLVLCRPSRTVRSEVSPPPSMPQMSPRSELAQALSSCRNAFFSIGLFSGMSNILMLTGAFFMLQIYDRVLPSRSVPTLVALAILVSVLFAALAILDTIRSRILVRIGVSLNEAISARVYDTIVRLPLKMGSRGNGLQPLRDLDSVRAFLSGPGPTALFDLPWMPLYVVIIFAFHTALGITALVGAIVLITLTLLTETLARRPMTAASAFAQTRNSLAEASRRNAEVLAAMGMSSRMTARWSEANQSYLTSHQKVSDVAGGFGSVSKALRMMLQSAVLGIGAYLVIHQKATAGIIIAAAILVARALAPVDLAIANWKGFLAARQSWQRLSELFMLLPAHETPMALPAPSTSLVVEQVSVVPPGGRSPVVKDVSFTLASGQGLGVIGPSASGKSSLIRVIVGAWQPAQGRIRLDGAALSQWSPEALGPHMGYLPQDVELFSGTVAENIARFEPEAVPEDIIAAAQAASIHDLIVALPQGYETEIGEQGQVLSAGQRQRIALARALYREPFLVVLDEPNSNLDAEGEAALTQAILGVRNRGGIVVVVAHRPSALAGADLILGMANGRAASFGAKDEVLSQILAKKPPMKRQPLEVVPDVMTKI